MKAKIKVVTVEVSCPACSDPIAHPQTGSFAWETVENKWSTPFNVTCVCGVTSTVEMSQALKRISY